MSEGSDVAIVQRFVMESHLTLDHMHLAIAGERIFIMSNVDEPSISAFSVLCSVFNSDALV